MKDLVKVIEALNRGVRIEDLPYGLKDAWSNDEDLSDCPKTQMIWKGYGRKQDQRGYDAGVGFEDERSCFSSHQSSR